MSRRGRHGAEQNRSPFPQRRRAPVFSTHRFRRGTCFLLIDSANLFGGAATDIQSKRMDSGPRVSGWPGVVKATSESQSKRDRPMMFQLDAGLTRAAP